MPKLVCRTLAMETTAAATAGAATAGAATDAAPAAGGCTRARTAAVHDDVPLLVRVLAGNPAAGVSILSCLDTADTRALRLLHVAVAGMVAGVPWYNTVTPVVDVVRWRAALPGAVGARLATKAVADVLSSDAAAAALACVTYLPLHKYSNVTDEVLLRLPASLRTLSVRECSRLTARASFAHLTALTSLDCGDTDGATASTARFPPSLQELDISTDSRSLAHTFPAGASLTHLTQLRVLRVGGTHLNDVTLASLPPGLVELGVAWCKNLTAAATFAHLPILQTLHAAGSGVWNAVLATLPPSLVHLDMRMCSNLTPAAVLPPLPALRVLDVSATMIGDAMVDSLPAGLKELHMIRCPSVTATATLDHVPALQTLYSMGTALAPAAADACRARGCAVPAAGVLHRHWRCWAMVGWSAVMPAARWNCGTQRRAASQR